MFWYRMAQDMQIRMVFSPEQVYNIASCVIETYKLSYEYEKFSNVGLNSLTLGGAV